MEEQIMRIATYNIWNSEQGLPYRTNCIIGEIRKLNADVICLQEIKNREEAEKISIQAGYQNYYDNYENEEEGLAILCNLF